MIYVVWERGNVDAGFEVCIQHEYVGHIFSPPQTFTTRAHYPWRLVAVFSA